MLRLLLAVLLAPVCARAAGPNYFTAVLNGDSSGVQAESWQALQNMVRLADGQGARLTLLFSPDYALYIATDAARLAELRSWKNAGHEVGAWYNGAGDTKPLAELEPFLKTACAESGAGPAPSPAPAYGICGLAAGRGDGGPAFPGVNDYLYVSSGSPKMLSGARPYDKQGFEEAKASFNGMKAGLYGAVFRSLPSEYGAFYAWLGFLRVADPGGGMSRTVFSAAAGGLLAEKELAAPQPEPKPRDGPKKKKTARKPPRPVPVETAPEEPRPEAAEPGKAAPKLRPVQSFYGKVGNNDFMPLGKKAAGYCGDGLCDAVERANAACKADCGK